ncbi:MAG: gluconate 2-dehydrogenase subunit 3 family protein [Rubricoccaceae bacterium]
MSDSPVGPLSRRDALRLLAVSAAAPALITGCQTAEESTVAQHAARRASGELVPAIGAEPGFFTEQEFETVKMLADYILPADDTGPSAGDAGVPEFIDHVMTDELLGDPTGRQTTMRGGLAWLNTQCLRAHGQPFTVCSDEQRRALLDRIAYPEDSEPADAPGVAFFSRMRDYTAMGYFSAPAGIESIGYIGNVAVPEWTGCPSEVHQHIGLTA